MMHCSRCLLVSSTTSTGCFSKPLSGLTSCFDGLGAVIISRRRRVSRIISAARQTTPFYYVNCSYLFFFILCRVAPVLAVLEEW